MEIVDYGFSIPPPLTHEWTLPTVAWSKHAHHPNDRKYTLRTLRALESYFKNQIKARYIFTASGRFQFWVYEICISDVYRFRLEFENDTTLTLYPIHVTEEDNVLIQTPFYYHAQDTKKITMSMVPAIDPLFQDLFTLIHSRSLDKSLPTSEFELMDTGPRYVEGVEEFPSDDDI